MRRALIMLAMTAFTLAAFTPGAAAQKRKRHSSFVEEMDCGGCHTPEGWGLSASAGGGGFDHAKTGFPLVGTHRDQGCTDCHRTGVETKSACVSCHAGEDAHMGRLGARCAECHTPTTWRDTNILERHRRTRFPLTGQHALATCSDCHSSATSERLWITPPTACAACHANDVPQHPDHTDPRFAGPCSTCHRPSGWSPALFDVQRALASARDAILHEARFPIQRGKHRGAPCRSCHPVAHLPRVVNCAGCHEHAPVKMRLAHRRVGGALAGCVSCHPGGTRR